MLKEIVFKILPFVREKKCSTDKDHEQTVAIYNSICIIWRLHHCLGLSFVHDLVPGDYTQLKSKFLSLLTIWNLFVALLVGSIACFRLAEVWNCFTVHSMDRFTKLILFIMLLTIVFCIITTGITSLIKSRDTAEFVRECSETEKRLNLSSESKCKLMNLSKYLVVLSIVFSLLDGVAIFLSEFVKCSLRWKILASAGLTVVVRLCSLAYLQSLIVYCEALRLYFKHIGEEIKNEANTKCQFEKCTCPTKLTELYELYIQVARLLSKVDALLNPVLILNYCGSFFICCCCIYLFAKTDIHHLLYTEIWMSFVFGLILMVVPSVTGGWMTAEAGRISDSLSELYISAHQTCYGLKGQTFHHILQNHDTRITASGFFSLSLGSVVKILGTLATYGMLLIESRDFFTLTESSQNQTKI